MVSNQKPPGKRKPIVSEGHARKHRRRVCSVPRPSGSDSALALVSRCPVRVYCSGSSLTLPLADEQRIIIFPCLSANGTDVFSLAHARFDSHFHCSGERK